MGPAMHLARCFSFAVAAAAVVAVAVLLLRCVKGARCSSLPPVSAHYPRGLCFSVLLCSMSAAVARSVRLQLAIRRPTDDLKWRTKHGGLKWRSTNGGLKWRTNNDGLEMAVVKMTVVENDGCKNDGYRK